MAAETRRERHFIGLTEHSTVERTLNTDRFTSFRQKLRNLNKTFEKPQKSRTETEYVKSQKIENKVNAISKIESAKTEPINYDHLLYALEEHLQEIPGKKVHEIGCGNGAGLYAARELGASVSGSENNSPIASMAINHGIKVSNNGALEAIGKLSRQQAIISRDVFDQIHTKKDEAKEIIDAARTKTDLMIHEVTQQLRHDRNIFLHPDWNTTFIDLLGQKTLIVMKKRS